MIGFFHFICFLYVVSLSSIFAVGPCDKQLVAKLSKIAECYSGGKAPKQTSSGEMGTHVVWTKDDFPDGVKCVTAAQCQQKSYVNYFLNNGSKVSAIVDFENMENYLREPGATPKDKSYRLYVIINELFVYAYYRCEEGSDKQYGNHQVNVAINCKYVRCRESLQVIERAKVCFSKLGIKHVIDVKPCPYGLCN